MRRREEERRQRFARLVEFDRGADAEAWGAGRLAGVDEAGVGPLAGPVVAAAVILPADFDLPDLYDSKQMTAAERQACAAAIRAKALALGVARVSPARIDRVNIRRAMLASHRIAIAALGVVPRTILVDGKWAPRLPAAWTETRTVAVVRGDSQSAAIAAASVIAKVARDRIMLRLHRTYPQYGFADHKGYSTAAHMQALREHGLSDVHRRSFCGFLEAEILLARQGSLAFDA